MRLAILGGSFNPMHLGHLFLADTVLSALHYDRVVLIPAYKSPFKLAAAGMEDSARDRLEMIAASIAGDPRLTVDPCEIRRGGVSYTVDTVADIIRRYAPDGKPGFIIGDDLAADFPQWHKSEEIQAMADIIIARRTSASETPVPYPCTQITNDVMEVSSVMIRERIAAGGAWRYLVPSAVRSIIEERGMYGFAAGTEGEASHSTATHNLILRVEEAVRESQSLERFLHSRNTALMSWDMCRRLSLDPQMGYLAGMAHDMAKPLSEKEMIKLVKNDGGRISRLEKEKPSLLHGRASAILLKERFNVHNEAVLEAIALHTVGGKNMGPLAKIVYIADKMEVSREKVDPAARKIVYSSNDLDRIFVMALDQTVSWLRAKKLKLSEDTLNLLEKMRRASG
jgi:nicotinate-nucleotide adenylyltransferase